MYDEEQGPAGFYLKLEASQALNFLVYVQNIYHNQAGAEKDRFPYCPEIGIVFREDFGKRFKTVWKRVASAIAEDAVNHTQIFQEERSMILGELAEEKRLDAHDSVIRSFEAWWSSTSFLLERSVDEKLHELYTDLAGSVHLDDGEYRELAIALVYDDCPLVGKREAVSGTEVVSVKDFYVGYEKLTAKLKAAVVE